MKILEIANKFVGQGIAVIPIMYQGKTPRVKWTEFKGGTPSSRLPTHTELQVWFCGLANFGVCTGWEGLHVLDFDSLNSYGDWLRWTAKQGGIAQYVSRQAYKVITRRGVHVYLRLKQSIKHLQIPGVLDVQGNGRYVVGAGSVHPSGAVYTEYCGGSFPLVNILSDVLPAGLLQMATLPRASSPAPVQAKPEDMWDAAWNAGTFPSGNLIQAVKAKFTIEQFFTNTVKTGDHFLMANCPFHDDENPSFWINTDKQICNCNAGCIGDKPFDVINLYARLQGLDNRAAILSMARRL